eukprot:GHVQ01039247.1.p1 GENE.GHVQ01039247.1~~GHVQ01039247.1.p1  ORF type:complete len:205 (+),score=8.52 GHVQ01039247.1:2020-2634(+)
MISVGKLTHYLTAHSGICMIGSKLFAHPQSETYSELAIRTTSSHPNRQHNSTLPNEQACSNGGPSWHVPIAIAPDNKCLQDHIDKLKRVISYASKREATMVLLHPDSFAAAKTTTVATESFTMNRRTLTAIRRPQLIARTFGSTIASRFRFKGSQVARPLVNRTKDIVYFPLIQKPTDSYETLYRQQTWERNAAEKSSSSDTTP